MWSESVKRLKVWICCGCDGCITTTLDGRLLLHNTSSACGGCDVAIKSSKILSMQGKRFVLKISSLNEYKASVEINLQCHLAVMFLHLTLTRERNKKQARQTWKFLVRLLYELMVKWDKQPLAQVAEELRISLASFILRLDSRQNAQISCMGM